MEIEERVATLEQRLATVQKRLLVVGVMATVTFVPSIALYFCA